MRWLYLHGWGSSPKSRKAIVFQQRYPSLDFLVPDLNQPDPARLALSDHLERIAAWIPGDEETVIIGSSFGGLTALWLAEQLPQVRKLVLLAPALQLQGEIRKRLGGILLRYWRLFGTMPMYHGHYKRTIFVRHRLWTDLAQYPDAALRRELPTLLIHGQLDEVIPVLNARKFARERPWIDFRQTDDDHALGRISPELWRDVDRFLGVSPGLG